MITQTDLIEAIENHLKATGITPAAFGKSIANDPSLVSDLRAGRSPRLVFAQKIMEAISPSNRGSA